VEENVKDVRLELTKEKNLENHLDIRKKGLGNK
jgi:hypothetical protein